MLLHVLDYLLDIRLHAFDLLMLFWKERRLWLDLLSLVLLTILL